MPAQDNNYSAQGDLYYHSNVGRGHNPLNNFLPSDIQQAQKMLGIPVTESRDSMTPENTKAVADAVASGRLNMQQVRSARAGVPYQPQLGQSLPKSDATIMPVTGLEQLKQLGNYRYKVPEGSPILSQGYQQQQQQQQQYGKQGMFGGTATSRQPYTGYQAYQPYGGNSRNGMFGAPTMNYNMRNRPMQQQQQSWSQNNPYSSGYGNQVINPWGQGNNYSQQQSWSQNNPYSYGGGMNQGWGGNTRQPFVYNAGGRVEMDPEGFMNNPFGSTPGVF